METCPICETHLASEVRANNSGIYSYRCRICGNVQITEEAIIGADSLIAKRKHVLSGITRQRTENGLPPILFGTDNIDRIISSSMVPSNISQQLDLILLYLERKSSYAGETINLLVDENYPLAFAKNFQEFRFLVEQLRDQKLIYLPPNGQLAKLNLDGWTRLDKIHTSRPQSKQVFVAMWFTPETDKAYTEAFHKAISECGFVPVRVDLIHHNDRIDDRIVAEIRKSAFLIADFTGNRGGVYFEAGFAMGLNIPVIWTCRKDFVGSVHFDTRQYNHIVWETPSELYQSLKDRIEATILK